MKVRVFVPGAAVAASQPSFVGKDHRFPILPSVGHILHFADETGEFTVRSAGFVQCEDGFMPAVWLEPNAPPTASITDKPAALEDPDRYRDLNHDVPPTIMTDY